MKDIPLFKVRMAESAKDKVATVLESGYIGQGPVVDQFEDALNKYLGTQNVVTVNSGTSALHLALHLIKDCPGDEVLTTPLTCTATNLPIVANGMKIRWVDISLKDFNICLDDLRRKLSPQTKAIMVVHWGGLPVDLDKLAEIQDECERLYGHRPPVIEDCAHALGSEFNGKKIGTHGNFCAFSFQAIKHLTTGDGGMLVVPDDGAIGWLERAQRLRWFGLDRKSNADFRCSQNIKEWGYKFQMNDIAAAIGLENLKDLGDVVDKHASNGNWLSARVKRQGVLTCPLPDSRSKSAYWILTVRTPSKRDEIMQSLKERGVATSRVHDRNDKHECLRKFRSVLPNTDQVCAEMFCVPCGWWLSQEDRNNVDNALTWAAKSLHVKPQRVVKKAE